jgi:DNA-directed RNA polymerase specialized sigma24 family protein
MVRGMSSNVAFPVAPLLHPAARRYDHEWRRLRVDPAAIARAASWGVARGPIASLDDVLVAVGYDRPRSTVDERNLRRLVCQARHDTLAAQVVVRRLMPGALSVAARCRRRRGDDTLAELLGALWIAVRTFDPGRTPACIAAALLADAEYRAFRHPRRRQLSEVPSDAVDEAPAPEPDTDPALELAELIDAALAAGLADADDIALLRLLAIEPSAIRVAARLNVTERTVRNRRARVAAILRTVAFEAAA